MFFAGAAFLVCVGGVSLVGASSSVAPGLSQDLMSFTSTRTAGLPFKDLFVNILGFNRFAHFVCAILLSQKDSPGWNFSKLWCGASQTLGGQRLRRVGSGLGELQIIFMLVFYLPTHTSTKDTSGQNARLSVRSWMNGNPNQVKLPLLSEPQGDWFTSQPATPACFCR